MNLRSFVIIGMGLLIIAFPNYAYSQYYFGQNKIQYSRFDWQVLTTDHFKIYFYPEEREVADAAAQIAEDSYKVLQEKFNHTIDKKIPFIIYSSPVFFEQTNIIPGLLPENVGGFTEFFKERVVVPFNGSYSDFAHVVRHEIVHVFTMEKITYVAKMHRKKNIAAPPLWFTEGIAEYWSARWDSQADMLLRDMVISGNTISVDNLYAISGTFLMYKVGQSLLKFLGETYGDDKLTDLFDNWWQDVDFNKIIEATYGKSLSNIGKEWEYSLKKTYYPIIEEQDLPQNTAQKLTQKGYNIKPAVFLKDTEHGRKEYIAFKSYRLGYSYISQMSIEGEKEDYKGLIKGGRSEDFESLHFVDTGLDANSEGVIAFASKSQESDALYIYDSRRDKVIDKIKHDSLVVISSPSWASDNSRIVFEGITRGGRSDLYLYDFTKAEFTRLTNDIYVDKTPAFCPMDDLIAFSSDRGENGNRGHRNLYLLDLMQNKIMQLTTGDWEDESPRWVKSSDKIIFSSDRNGSSNIYALDGVFNGHRQISQITNFITGAFDPQLASNDSILIFSGYQDFSFHIYKMPLPDHPISESSDSVYSYVKLDNSSWQLPKWQGELSQGSVKYQPKLSFDIAQSAMAYDAVAGPMGGLQFVLSDMLGNHQFYFLLYNTANTRTDILKSFNAGVTYLNRTDRLNWGGGIYHFYDEYNDDYYGFVRERVYGGVALASYPVSKFRRFETALNLRRIEKNVLARGDTYDNTAAITLSYIKDTSLWDPTGPIDGTRVKLSTTQAIELGGFKQFNSSYNFDFRKYFRLSANTAFASRVLYSYSTGRDPQRYYLGGSWTMRGYSHKYFYGRNMVLLNNELRFPLIEDLSIRFPFGGIGFQSIRGAVFVDAGNAWETKYHGLFGSFGFGMRVALGYVTVLRFDFARKTDFRNFTANNYNFDFFFGWNF